MKLCYVSKVQLTFDQYQCERTETYLEPWQTFEMELVYESNERLLTVIHFR